MDKIKKYKQLTLNILNDIYADLSNNPNKSIKPYIIKDEKAGHYLLYLDGWKEARRIYGCSVHVQVDDLGKVHLNLDSTDLEIGQKLLDNGVEKSDLVLAFIAPQRRADAGFALV